MHIEDNPLSPNIHIQILQTDLYKFPLRMSWENLIKDQSIFSWVIISLILITYSHDNVWILLGENCCWTLLGLKAITGFKTPTGGRLQQFALHKHGPGFELGRTENNSSKCKWPERESNPGLLDYEPNKLTTQPRCFLLLSTIEDKIWALCW